jgi:hypothetical protein
MSETTPPEDFASLYRRAFQEFGRDGDLEQPPIAKSDTRRCSDNNAQPAGRR